MSMEGNLCDYVIDSVPPVKCGRPASAEFTTHDFNGPPMNGARGYLCVEHFKQWKFSAAFAPTVGTKREEPKP